MVDSLTTYVDLIGRADIRMAPDGKKIALYIYKDDEIINEKKPFVFTNIPSKDTPLKFLNIDLIAEFGEESFAKHLATIQALHPGLTWEKAEDPEPGTKDQMNSTDPPTRAGLPTKYVDLTGRADIRMTSDGNVALYIYKDDEIINEDNPIIFTHIPSLKEPLKFVNINLTAEFGPESFELHIATIQALYPGLTWKDAEEPDADSMPFMNSTDPPRRG